MSQAYVQAGKLLLSLTHLKCLRREELEMWVDKEAAARLMKRAAQHRVFFEPLPAELKYSGGTIVASPGLILVSGLDFELSPEPLVVEGRNDEFVWQLLISTPRQLDEGRRPVLVEELDARFSRHQAQGLRYSLDVMERVSGVYKVPFVVTGSARLATEWRWLHFIIKAKGSRGEELLVIDGEVKAL